jgi:hypothetical protein
MSKVGSLTAHAVRMRVRPTNITRGRGDGTRQNACRPPALRVGASYDRAERGRADTPARSVDGADFWPSPGRQARTACREPMA